MITKKDKDISPKSTSIAEDEVGDLKEFVQKKKNQNEALKKLITKLNTNQNNIH